MNTEEKHEFIYLSRISFSNQTGKQRQRYRELEKLWMRQKVARALEVADIDSWMDIVIELTPSEDLPELARQLAASIKYMPGHCSYVVVKCDTMDQEEKVKAFVEREIHTTVNEQIFNLF